MRSKRSAAARMVQQLKLYCVDCGARAFYGSPRGPVCAFHKRRKSVARKKAAKKISAKEESKPAGRRHSTPIQDARNGKGSARQLRRMW
jgi:hypothetical protein